MPRFNYLGLLKTLIMQMLRDNLTLWTRENNGDDE